MGIDHSKRTLGLALSSPDLSIAMPLKTIQRSGFSADIATLFKLCKEYAVGGFVIGLPLNMSGTEGPRVDSVRHFAENMIREKALLGFDPPISFFDERLSTYAADQFLIERDDLSKKRRGEIIDKLAAQIILQGALEKIRAS